MLIKVIWKNIEIVENMKYGLSRGKDQKQSVNHTQLMGIHTSCVCLLLTWSLRDLHEFLFGVESSYGSMQCFRTLGQFSKFCSLKYSIVRGKGASQASFQNHSYPLSHRKLRGEKRGEKKE